MKQTSSLLFILIGAALASIAWSIWYSQSLSSTAATNSQSSELFADSLPGDTRKPDTVIAMAASSQGDADDSVRFQALERQLAELQQALIQEQRDRMQLGRELETVEAELDRWVSAEITDSDSGSDTRSALPSETIFSDAAPSWFDDFGGRGRSRSSDVSDQQALIAAGVDQASAEELSTRLDQRALALLELRDQAIREEWVDSSRYRTERNAINDSVDLRGELGDDGWDAYLYSAGRNNRVGVTSVLNGSAAANAGITPGDSVLAYAGQRIFTISELQQATRDGQRNETVSIDIGRQDVILTLSIPRGPLGVTLTAGREDPAASADL